MAVSSEPGRTGRPVVKSDATLIGGCRALYVGGAGDIVVDFPDTTDVTFKAVGAGSILPITPLRVKAATTATDIVALY